MAQPAWSLTPEPAAAQALRRSLTPESPADVAFWQRDDLTYLGDLQWCNVEAMRGLEYIANIRVGPEEITYDYGLINLDPTDAVAGALVCPVRAQRQAGYPFVMQINGDWLEGPLRFWLDQLAPEVQEVARQRYRLVIAWAEAQSA